MPGAQSARVNLLYLPAGLLALSALWQDAAGLALGLAGAAAWAGAVPLLRDGLRGPPPEDLRGTAMEGPPPEETPPGDGPARRAALRMVGAGLLTGLGASLAAWSHGSGAAPGALYMPVAALLHGAGFGTDLALGRAWRATRAREAAPADLPDTDTIDSARRARLARRAEEELAALDRAGRRIRDAEVADALAGFAASAREMTAHLHDAPAGQEDLGAARRFLGVYLSGAREAAESYARIYGDRAGPAAPRGPGEIPRARHRREAPPPGTGRDDARAATTRGPGAEDLAQRRAFLALLEDLQRNFAARTGQMSRAGARDMAIEIDVLRDRLAQEGLDAATDPGPHPAPHGTAPDPAGDGPAGTTRRPPGKRHQTEQTEE